MTNTVVTEASVYGWLLIKLRKNSHFVSTLNERQIDKEKNAIRKR